MMPPKNIAMEKRTTGRFPKQRAIGIQNKLARPMANTEYVTRADSLSLSAWKWIARDSNPVVIPDYTWGKTLEV